MNDQNQNTQDPEIEALRKELAAAELEIESARERRDARKTPTQLRADIEKAKREAKELDIFADLEAKHGEADQAIKRIDTLHGMVVVKRPQEMAYRKFADMEKVTTSAAKELAHACLIYPEKATFNDWAADEPAIIARAANAACWLAGNRKELDEKK